MLHWATGHCVDCVHKSTTEQEVVGLGFPLLNDIWNEHIHSVKLKPHRRHRDDGQQALYRIYNIHKFKRAVTYKYSTL